MLAVFDSTGSGNAIRAGVRLQEQPRRLQQETSLIQNCECTVGIAIRRVAKYHLAGEIYLKGSGLREITWSQSQFGAQRAPAHPDRDLH